MVVRGSGTGTFTACGRTPDGASVLRQALCLGCSVRSLKQVSLTHLLGGSRPREADRTRLQGLDLPESFMGDKGSPGGIRLCPGGGHPHLGPRRQSWTRGGQVRGQAVGRGLRTASPGSLTLLGSSMVGPVPGGEDQQAEQRSRQPRHQSTECRVCPSPLVEAGTVNLTQGTPQIKRARRPLSPETEDLGANPNLSQSKELPS